MHKTDMVMHIDNYLGENTRRSIEKAITATRGVLHAHFNEKRPHLMLVSYDTERTSSFEVLARMTKQQVTTLHLSNGDFWSLFFCLKKTRLADNYNDNACLTAALTSASASAEYSLAGTLPHTGPGHATSE